MIWYRWGTVFSVWFVVKNLAGADEGCLKLMQAVRPIMC